MEDLYSKRNRQSRTTVISFEELPEAFCNQVVHICNQAVGWHHNPRVQDRLGYPHPGNQSFPPNDFWQDIKEKVVDEHGLLSLPLGGNDSFESCMRYMSQAAIGQGLDVIELAFRKIETLRKMSDRLRQRLQIKITPDEAIKKLNRRFQENNLGYRYEAGRIIAVNSDFYHQEVTSPAFTMLRTSGFEGPLEEFHQAYQHYRSRNHDSAIVEACKAFESALKAIFDQRGIPYDKDRATLRDLLALFLQNGLAPIYFQDYFTNLEKVLQCIGTVRSKEGAHGDGSEPREPEEHLVAFSLHQAAANIIFVIECHTKSKPK